MGLIETVGAEIQLLKLWEQNRGFTKTEEGVAKREVLRVRTCEMDGADSV
jgi:hypothetical protein